MKDIITLPNAQHITQLTFFDYYYYLAEMAQTVYEWHGLPDGIDPKHIERYLFNEGSCMFFKDSNFGWMVTKCLHEGELNYYDDPTELFPVATNYMEVRSYTPGEDCVFIQNNKYRTPTCRTTRLYAARLAEMQRTADINIVAQKTPVIVKGSDKQRLSLKAVIKQWFGNEPLIFGDKTLDTTEMKVLNTAAPVVFDRLTIEKNKLMNEYMTRIGVNNANTDKRERLVDDEVQANNAQIEISGFTRLEPRERAAEEISKLTGQKVTVTARQIGRGDTDPAATHRSLQEGDDQ